MERQEKIMIGCPIRNRAWILPDYLQAILNFDYPAELIELCFIVNDCQDSTPAILSDFAAAHENPVYLYYDNQDHSGKHQRGYYNFRRLAHLRNQLITAFLRTDCEYLFSLDSDIIMPPESIMTLLGAQRDIISALVWNGGDIGSHDTYNILKQAENGDYLHIREFPVNGVFEVDCTGAAYLLRRRVLSEFMIRYDADYGAEDIGFCKSAQRAGIKLYCHSGVRGRHFMEERLCK